MERDYIEEGRREGVKGHTVLERIRDGIANEDEGHPVLHLPEGTPPQARFDVLRVLREAYRYGREDRAGEAFPAGRDMDPLLRQVRLAAASQIASWLTGWTDDGSGGKYHIAVTGTDRHQGETCVSVSRNAGSGHGRRLRIRVVVEEEP